jgi:hypothetical protein
LNGKALFPSTRSWVASMKSLHGFRLAAIEEPLVPDRTVRASGPEGNPDPLLADPLELDDVLALLGSSDVDFTRDGTVEGLAELAEVVTPGLEATAGVPAPA